MTKKDNILLFIILAAAAVLRLYRLETNPPSMSWDEVSIGYNAYSILKTGMDEHKRFMPADTFTAFGDYKPPVSVYMTVPFVKIFGLTESAVRLPSAIAGIAAVYLTYLVAGKLFGMQRKSIAVLTAVLLANSPWHIMLSRAGFEANIATTLMLWGVYLALKSREYPRYLLYCWLPFVLAFYTFNSSRYFLPVLSLALVWFIRDIVRKNSRLFAAGIVLSAIFMLPILPHLFSKEARLRFAEVNIFNDYPLIYNSNERIALDNFAPWGKLFHNFRLVYARSYLMHYLDHFQPWFLFIRGDGNPKFSIQDTGQLYLIEAPFLVLGAYYAISRYRSVAVLLSVWIFGAIVPAAVARETPHALRIENSLPVWQMGIALGIAYGIASLKRFRFTIAGLLLFLYLGSLGFFLHNYFIHYPEEFSGEWQYGYREAVRYAESVKGRYDTIVVSDAIGRPYIYTLFYGRYDPEYFWKTRDAGFDAAGFYNVKGFGKYRYTDAGVGAYPGNVLYILPPRLVPDGARILKTVNLLNGQPALIIFTV